MKIFLIALGIEFIILFPGCSNNKSNKFIEASGTIESTNVVVSSKGSGIVENILFDEGEKIKIGDTVVIVDHEQLDLQLIQAIAVKNAAQAQLNLMLAGARKEDIIQAEQNLNQAKVNFENAEKDKNRIQNLYAARSVTQKQYDDAIAKYELMNAQYKTAQENFSKIKHLFRSEEIDQAKANVEKAAAGVKLLQKSIRDCYVTSPINGFLVNVFIEKGENVSPMTSLFEVSDLDQVELIVYVSTEDLALVKLGQTAEIKIDAYKDKIYRGKVIYISSEAEFTPKNIQTKDERTKLVFAVKIKIANKNYDLKSGMPADVKIILDSDKS